MALSLKKPSKEERSERKTKKAAAKLGDGEKRIVADVPEHIHRQVRIKCLQRGVLVRDYILELLAKDGIK
jgi:predicted DNA binding CopG/RHH family protein